MKVGINSYCYHRLMGEPYPDQSAPDKNMSVGDFLQKVKTYGADAVIMESFLLPSLDRSYMLELKSQLDSYNLERVLAWGHPSGLERGKNEAHFEQMKALIPLAKLAGADIMRVVASSYAWRDEPHAEQIERLVQQFREAAKVASDNGIKLAIENNMDFTAAELLRLVEEIDAPNVGITFDSGNFVRLLEDPVTACDLLASHTFLAYLKDVQVNTKEAKPNEWFFFSCVPVGQGLVRNEAVVGQLAKSGYDGIVSVASDHPAFDWYDRENELVELSVREVRDIIARVQ